MEIGGRLIDKGVKQYTQEVALDTAKKVTASSTGKMGVIKDSITKIIDLTKANFPHCCSGVITFPSSVEANPH